MRTLSTAIVVEGASDRWFLPVVLRRALNEIFLEHAPQGVEVADIQVLDVDRSGGLVEGVIEAARRTLDTFTILFYHYDGTANPAREMSRYWMPLAARWDELSCGRELVAVVPVREMEAWVLADAEAVCTVIGHGWSADWSSVESLRDPKLTLRQIAAYGRGRRVREPKEYLPRIARELSIERLRAVPSFQRWSADTIDALRKMRFLP